MKKYGFIALLMGFMMLVIPSILIPNEVSAQAVFDGNIPEIKSDNTVKVEFKIYINDKLVEKDDFQFIIVNKKHKLKSKLKMSEAFTAFLDFNQDYTFVIGHKDFNTKVIDINTNAPIDQSWTLKCNIFLYNNESDGYAGRLAYANDIKNFKYYKY